MSKPPIIPKPTHRVTINCWVEDGGRAPKYVWFPDSGDFIFKDDKAIASVEELPKPIEAGDWVTINRCNAFTKGLAYEVLHVHDHRAWLKDKDNHQFLINIEDITRTTF